MLVPQFKILPQSDCQSLHLLDTTCSQSTECLGGYGSPNIAKSAITRAKVTLDFGVSGAYSVTKVFDPVGPFVITSKELSTSVSIQKCGTCDNQAVGHVGSLPSGCVTITYEPQYEQESEWVTAGKKTSRFILKCTETYQAAELSKRVLDYKFNCKYDSTHTESDTEQALADIFLIQGDLLLLEGEELLCSHITTILNQINVRLKNLQSKW